MQGEMQPVQARCVLQSRLQLQEVAGCCYLAGSKSFRRVISTKPKAQEAFEEITFDAGNFTEIE